MKTKHILSLVFGLIFLAAINMLYAAETGLPFLRSYHPEEMGGWPQNWGAVQDSTGKVYIANGLAVIEYDGNKWEKIIHPDNDRPLSIAINDLDKIFIGFRNDIGFISNDSLTNKKIIQSLSSFLPDSIANFSQIWGIACNGNDVYFQDIYRIIHLKIIGDNPQWWQWSAFNAPGNNVIWSINNMYQEIYCGVQNIGLCKLDGDNLIPLSGTKSLKHSVIKSATDYDESTLIVCSESSGLQLLRDESLSNFPGPIYSWSKNFQTDKVLHLSDGRFAASSFSGGIVIFDSAGNILSEINDTNGLLDNMVGGILLDRQEGLWACQNFGLTRIEISSPFDVYDAKLGLRGNIYTLTRFRGTLFAGTSDGLYYLDAGDNKGKPSRFKKVNISPSEVWTLIPIEDRLIIPTTRFTYQLENIGGNPEIISNDHDIPVSSLKSEDGKHIYLGTVNEGILVLEKSGKRIITVNRINDSGQLVLNLTSDNSGNIWFSANERNVGRISEKSILDKNPEIEFYDADKGLDAKGRSSFFIIEEKLYLSNDNGIFAYDKNSDWFTRIDFFDSNAEEQYQNIISPVVDKNDKLWFWDEKQQLNVARISGDKIIEVNSPYNRGITKVCESSLFENKYAWFGFSGSKLVRINTSYSKYNFQSFKPVISSILLPDSSNLLEKQLVETVDFINLPFENNSLRFSYSLPCFDDETSNVYQYRLIGLNNSWSNWSSETYHDFNSLHEGLYRFELRGKDAWGKSSEISEFKFSIHPPWYRSRLAYISYFFLLIIIFFTFDRIRTHRIKARNRLLEKIIKERTDEALAQFEIAKQKEIEAQQLRAANMLAATIAHEFNNPLGIIKGIIDLVNMKGLPEETKLNQINKIPPHVERMAKLVDKLLRIENLKEIDYTSETKIFDLNAIDKKVEDKKLSEEKCLHDSN